MKLKNIDLQGFTLSELSIVIIIIGVLIAGISTGSSLMRETKLNTVISDLESYRTSLTLFKTKYKFYPGDLPHASMFWPSCNAAPSKCDGNGNGIVEPNIPNSTDQNESFRAWQHLLLAGFIKGKYTGVATVAGQADIGINIPASKHNSGGYTFAFYGSINTIDFGKYIAGATSGSNVLTPQEAYQIDKKIDDGFARTGLMWGAGAPSPTGCYNLVNNQYMYNISLNTNLCFIHFIFQSL